VGWWTTPTASEAARAPFDTWSNPDKRIDAMAAEIKDLRKSIDGLRKALEDRK
jgi:hypothetical protein